MKKTVSLLIMIFALILTACSSTQNEKETIEEKEEKMVMEKIILKVGKNRVNYFSNGENVVADVYLPLDYKAGEKRAAIVVSPPASGVKEQTVGLYAEELSKKGFITIAFDPRGWGESEGHRLYFSPYRIAEDARNAVNLMTTFEEVDTENIYALGICMGAGIAAYETAYDARIKGLAVVSPYLPQPGEFLKAYGGAKNMRERVLPVVAASSQKYFATGESIIRKMVPETEEEKKVSTPVGVGMMAYYLPGKPGNVPNWVNGQTFESSHEILSFSIFNDLDMLEPVPTLVIYGDEAITKAGAERFYREHKGVKKELVFEGAGHFDLYWMPEYVNPGVDAIGEFFNNN